MTDYQITHLIFLIILVAFWSLLGLFGKSKYSLSGILSGMVSIGGGMALLGLVMSWLISHAPIIELATLVQYETTLGFIRLYIVGLSILLAMPALIIFKLVFKR
jgi:hypothetical protein